MDLETLDRLLADAGPGDPRWLLVTEDQAEQLRQYRQLRRLGEGAWQLEPEGDA